MAGIVASVVVLAVVVAPVHVRGDDLVWGTSCAEAAPATFSVGLVVDFGILKDSSDPSSQVVTCLRDVPARSSGFDVLQVAGHSFRLDPRTGLLCAIDGLPADGCGVRTPSGYRYWAYFHGSGSTWVHAGNGPAGFFVTTDAVEGWHFVEGAGNPSDPGPRRSPANVCPPLPPPPPDQVVPTTPRPTTGAPAVPSAPGGPSPSPGATPAPAPAGGPTPTTATGSPDLAGTPGATSDGVRDDGSTGDASNPTPDGTDGSPPGSAADRSDAGSDVTIIAAGAERADGDGSSDGGGGSSGGGAPAGTLGALAVVAALGGAAAWRFRARSADAI